MRIIGGSAAGRIIDVPKGLSVRPTPDKVRQAIFNSLGDLVVDADVLELFGGSGALSLECVSRGARTARCIEKSSKHATFIRNNATATGLNKPNYNVIVGDVFPVLKRLQSENAGFDLILADPPFGDKTRSQRSESLTQRLLDSPELTGLLRPNGLLVVGHAKRDQVEIPAQWLERKTLKHGDSIFRLLHATQAVEEQPLLEPVE